MTSYNVIVFVHVVSAVVLVGGGLLATPTINGAIRSVSTVSELRRWLAIGRPLGRINLLSSLALLASGIYLASAGGWWQEAWVQVAAALWILNATLGGWMVKPAMARLAAAAAALAIADDEVSSELEVLRASPSLTVTSDVMVAGDVGVLFLMVTKPPGHLVSLLVIVVAQLAILGFRALRPPVSAIPTASAGSLGTLER